MRNLKRALSLGLTATMISGLMVMGSSAASYADVTSKQNEEAIEVLKTVGIMVGDENGKFNPDAKVTRNEMAVVMCNLLDYTVASYKGTSPFTDVPEWAEPYVAACYTNGITSGYDKVTYGGNDTVTTGQAALMLLKALGYFQYSADFGSDWLVETTKNGSTAGLFDGVATGAKEALTRNDVAQMVLNALEADLVKAEKNGSDVQVGDIVISGGKATYDSRTGTDSKYAKIDNTKVDGKYTIQLGEDLYDGDLVKADGADDDFGRPSVKWTYENKEIGTYADDADAVYTATVEKQDLYDLVGSDVYNDLKNGDADFTVVKDGVAQDVKLSDYIVKNNDDDAGKDVIKKGATTEVFIDDDSNDVVIAVINSYVAQVDGDYDKNDEELELDILDEAFVDVKDTTLSSDDFDYLDSYSDEDYVLITVADKEIKSIALAETVEGKVTAYTEKKNVTVDGTKYEYSKNYTDAVKKDSNLSYDLNDAYTLVLDANGYVIYTDGTAGHNDYVYVAEIAPTGGAKADLEADAYFIDGTNKVVVVDNDDEIKDNATFENKWYSYNEKSNGKYELEAITGEKNETYTVSADNQKIVENGKSSIYTDKVGGAKANNDTIFVVNDDDDVTAYTGIKNVPDITSKTADVTVAVVNDGSYADVVYIYSADMSISGDSGDRVYLLEESPNASVDKDDNKYYEYDAIVNGEITTVKATDKDLKIGLYQNVSYDENGYMDDQDLVKDASDDDFKVYTGIKTISYKSGVLSLGSNDVVLADSYKIFVNDDGDGKTTTPSSLAKNFGVDGTYSENVFVFEDDNDEAVEVYVYKIKDADKNDADKVDAKIDHVQMWADGGFNIVMNQKAEQDTNFTVELQQRVDGKYVSAGTKKVTLKKDATTVSDDGDKFLLDTGSVYKVVVNGVESNEVKGK
ncbi:MAG: S-layer homology domain-containing protein [Oscillospiraceae bacterium]|nr:S-layer homology domain-containing protein [Oscillospiraceae bacterium]